MKAEDEFWEAVGRMTYQEAIRLSYSILEVATDRGWILNTTDGPVDSADVADLLTSIAGTRDDPA